jgi:hypothetical protein
MRTIWKFPLAVADNYQITMPKGAQILTVQRQNEQACLWAIVDTNAEKERRVFEIHGTGNPIDDDAGLEHLFYVGTFQSSPFVWHVFERV